MEPRRLLHATLLSLLLYVCGAAACFPPDKLALRQIAAFSLRQNRSASFPKGFLGYGGALEAKPTAFVGWDGEECCSWRGVVCNSGNYTAAARISKLLLSDANLAGAIPQAICSLTALSTLDLSDNFLTGAIPTCFAHNLSNLRHLDLSHNYLNGTMLPVNNLTSLLHLDLSFNNYFGNPVLEAICSLSALSTLDLSGNFATASIPTCFAHNLTKLRSLDLAFTGLNGTTLPVSALPHLTYLDLSGNAFDSIPPFQTPRLRWLRLGELGAIPPIFTNGTSNDLQYLDLRNNFFPSGISNVLFTFPLQQLQYLDLSGCDLSSHEIPVTEIISQLPELRILLLNFSMLAAEGKQISKLLCGLKSLEVLSVSGDRDETFGNDFGYWVGEMLLPARCKSPSLNLTLLDVSNNKLRGPFPAWLSLFSNLQVLRLSGNNFDFHSSAITPEWQNLTHLRDLQLSGPTAKPTNPFLLPQQMQISWLFRLPLETLTLSSLGIANQHIPCSQLSLLNASLHYLDFSHNLLTGAHALHCLARSNFTSLETLDLSNNALALNLGLIAFPPSLVRTELILNSCQLNGELTDEFFGMLRSIRPSNYTESKIYLAQNSFSGSLPLGIGVLVGVEKLDLSYNNFTGHIPLSLGNMSYLRFLSLEHNHLEGEVPQELGNITSLNDLFLGNNKLTKWLPAKYNQMLDILDLSYNRLEGDLEQTFFGHYSMLETVAVLLLGHNRLSGAIPHTLLNGTSAPWLSIIQLSDNRLSGTIPQTLFNLFPSLTVDAEAGIAFESSFKLVVKNLELSYDDRSKIFTYLDLSNNRLNGSIPESLGQLSSLRYLNLSRKQLTANIPSSLSNLSLLESLDLSYNRLQGSLPTSLSELTKLAVFNVSYNEELSGPIPANSPQFEDSTSYIGDLKLCGDPYLQRCPDMKVNVGSYPEEDHKIEGTESFLMQWMDEWIAIPGLCLGIVVGFLGALWVLRFISFI